ncbi:hypothetical protein LBMAG32_08370 [Nitrosomonadaceae bacterium]|nr:hypothetical protein LBMAG32_08370 [Nitrosomonadaceae bacterium]
MHSKGVREIEKIRIDSDPIRRIEMMKKTGRRTVPQIYIGEVYVGGYDDLVKLDSDKKLTKLLID